MAREMGFTRECSNASIISDGGNLDGGTSCAHETIEFDTDRTTYAIDLSDTNAKKLLSTATSAKRAQ
jgi:hypothetical protein